jgi:hypothetical protein
MKNNENMSDLRNERMHKTTHRMMNECKNREINV